MSNLAIVSRLRDILDTTTDMTYAENICQSWHDLNSTIINVMRSMSSIELSIKIPIQHSFVKRTLGKR